MHPYPLERALRLMERDYRRSLLPAHLILCLISRAISYQMDYTMIAYYLMNCYSNMEDPEKVYELAAPGGEDGIFSATITWMPIIISAWTVHRNRFYTSAKYSFLKNSIDENEKLAQRYLDSGFRQIAINRRLKKKYFHQAMSSRRDYRSYHYKSILYGYAFNIDSASHYYDLMRSSPVFPHNNYRYFRFHHAAISGSRIKSISGGSPGCR